MKKVPVRRFLDFTTTDLKDNLRRNVVVVFEDNVEVEMNWKEVIINRYLWELITITPELPISSRYNVVNFYNNGMYIAKSPIKVMEAIFEDMIPIMDRMGNRDLLLPIFKKIYEITTYGLFNELVHSNLGYCTSINILDYLEIQLDERLISALRKVEKDMTASSINESYQVLDNVMNDNKYANNVIAKAYNSGTANPNQIRQMLAARGFVTEINSNIFKYPIATSYTLGLRNIYDLTIESRSGAKSLIMSTKAIKESEYFAREMQLVTMELEELVDGDCGNHDYMDWLVREDNGNGKSDLENLIDKYYFNEETQQEELITKNHTHLIGKTIKLRTVIRCKMIEKNKICTRCFGRLSYSSPEPSNIGKYTITTLSRAITQSLLSNKHLVSSATAVTMHLDMIASKYFTIKNKDSIAFKSNMLKLKSKYSIVVEQSEAFGLKDIDKNTVIKNLMPSRISRIQEFLLVVESGNGTITTYPIKIGEKKAAGSFTYEFLTYIAENGYTVDDEDRYVIPINEQVTSQMPIIKIPQVEYNFLQLALAIKSEFKTLKTIPGEGSVESPESLLQKIFDMVMSKLSINITIIDTIVAAFIVYDFKNNNFDLGRNSPDPQLASLKDIIKHRSMGVQFAWEEYLYNRFNPENYYKDSVEDHVLDVMIKPNETIANHYGRYDALNGVLEHKG